MASSESTTHDSAPVVRMENISLMAPSSGTTTLNSESTTTQFISFPILNDVTLPGTDQQNIIFARTTDGNTILLDASQLALLADQGIPLYDATSVYQIADSDASIAITKSLDIPVVAEATEVEQSANNVETEVPAIADEEEILPPDRLPHKCNICGQEFSEKKFLHRHWKLHAEDKPHRCDECDASFNRKNNLILHQATHCTSDPACPICKRKFTRMASLKAHLMLHETEENLTCTECGFEFATQFKLDKHMQDHLAEVAMDNSFICRTCSRGFKKLSHLREHSKVHYKLKASLQHRTYRKNIDRSLFSHKCYFCGKQFQKPSQLLRHNRIHTGERPYKCEVCNKAFNQKGALLIHMVKHTGNRPHLCEFCPASFAQKGNLRNHIRRVHTLLHSGRSDEDGIHKCELCSCVFRKLNSLNAHMSRIHSSTNVILDSTSELDKDQEPCKTAMSNVIDELIEMSKQTESAKITQEKLLKMASETFSADILQQALENSGLAPTEKTTNSTAKSYVNVMTVADAATGTLKTHIIRKVGGVRWYQCMYCTKEFKKLSDLVRHIRIHTHEKPYKCDQCFRAFAVKSTLNAHIRTHSGTKNYACEHCQKMFSTSGSVKVHTLLHTGAKPFKCTSCDKSFRTSGHRNSHMHSHESGKSTKRTKRSLKMENLNNINMSNVPLQEPILITDGGFVQPASKSSYQQMVDTSCPASRPYRCATCLKGFKKSSHLKQHIRSHTGEKPYECNECHKTFVSNGVLKSHLKTHYGIKDFKCPICEASFTTNGSLRRHLSIHRDERPYMCPYCQKTFKTSMNCKKHMKTHRYEIALGLSAGVPVTVVSGNGSAVLTQENLKDTLNASQVTRQVIENADIPIVEVSETQPVITSYTSQVFNPESDQNIVGTENLAQISNLQEVFNVQTGMIEQAEIVQAPSFDPTQGSIFTLSGTEFVENHLTLQLENNEDNVLPNSTINDPLVSSVSNAIAESEAPCEVIQSVQKESDNTEVKKKVVKKNYKCSECLKVFRNSKRWKVHLAECKDAKPAFPCKVCGVMFKNEIFVREHMKTHQTEEGFKCVQCNAVFSVKRTLVRHMVIHDTNRPLQCSYCRDRFDSRDEYKEHLSMYHSNTFAVVDIPNEDSTAIATYQEDPESVPEEIILEAEKNTINAATKEHDSEGNDCPCCSKTFKNPSDLACHLRIHSGEKPFSCQICDKSFSLKSTLNSHLRTHEDTGEKSYSCEVCDRSFSLKSALNSHLRIHNDKQTRKIVKLEMYTGPKHPHVCPECPKSFKKPSDLIRHTRIHTGEKPYSCHCGKSFTVKSTLDSHLRTHTGERNFSCHICDSLFATKGSLNVHLRLHTGVRPFKCSLCDLTFRTSGHRKSHVASHFKDRTSRKGIYSLKKYTNPGYVTIDDQNQEEQDEFITPVAANEVINIQTEPAAEIQIPITQEEIQLQLPPALVGQNIQITTLDPSFLSKTIQIDPAILQQLQQNFNINITLTPSLPDQTGKIVDINQSQSVINLEANSATVPATSGAFTVNPMILQPISYTIPQQLETSQVTDTIPITISELNLNKNGTSEVIQNGDILDSHVVTLDNNLGTEVILESSNKNSSEALSIGNNTLVFTPRDDSYKYFACPTCSKVFKTSRQLNAHQAVHKSAQYIYRCEMCDKNFKKKNHFFKHMQIHTN